MFRKLIFSPCILLAVGFAIPGVGAQEPGGARAAGDAIIDAFKRDDLAAIEAHFDAAMKQGMTHEKFVGVMSEVKRKLGALKSCAAPISQQQGAISVFDYPCEFAADKATIRLAYKADLTLGGLFFLPPKF